MSSNNPGPHPEDLPWNDVPDDDALIPGAVEPDPAEVVGDETDARDLAARRIVDPDIRETLDERLAEEEPDSAVDTELPEQTRLIDGESGEDGVAIAEPDPLGEDVDDEPSAEEAAVHLRDA
jgi:hypothetical protein